MTEDKYKCLGCGEDCGIEQEEIHYSGTHCTNGRSGVHKTGFWESDCCQDDFLTYDELDGEEA